MPSIHDINFLCPLSIIHKIWVFIPDTHCLHPVSTMQNIYEMCKSPWYTMPSIHVRQYLCLVSTNHCICEFNWLVYQWYTFMSGIHDTQYLCPDHVSELCIVDPIPSNFSLSIIIKETAAFGRLVTIKQISSLNRWVYILYTHNFKK